MTDNLDPSLRLARPESPFGPGAAVQPQELGIAEAFSRATGLYSGFLPSEYESIARMYKGTAIDPTFDPFAQPEMKQRPDLPLRLGFTRSRAEFDAVHATMMRQEADKQALENSGFTGFAMSALAGMMDPGTMLSLIVPAGVSARAGTFIGAAGGVASLASQAQRSDLSFTDVALNIGLGALAGRASGVSVRGSSLRLADAIEAQIENRLKVDIGEIDPIVGATRNTSTIERVLVEERLARLRENGVEISPGMANATDEERLLARHLSGDTPFVREDGSPSLGAFGAKPAPEISDLSYKSFIDWIDKYTSSFRHDIADAEGLRSWLDQGIQKYTVANDMEAVAQLLLARGIVDVIPETYLKNMKLRVAESLPRVSGGLNPAGAYFRGDFADGLKDLVITAIRSSESMDSSLAHEIGHRVSMRFLNEADLNTVHSIWTSLNKPNPGWGSAFSEWMAEEFRKAAQRAKAGTLDMGKSEASYAAWRRGIEFDRSIGVKGDLLYRVETVVTDALLRAGIAIEKIARQFGKDPEVARQKFFDSLITNPRKEVSVDFEDWVKNEKILSDTFTISHTPKSYDRSSLGHAMATQNDGDTTLRSTRIGLEKLAYNPTLRLMNNPVGVLRDFATRALDLGGMFLNQNFAGEATPIPAEVGIKVSHLPRYVDAVLAHRDAYMQYRSRLAGNQAAPGTFRPVDALKQFASDIVNGRGGALSATEFDDAVGRQLHGLDQQIPEVTQAASFWRKFYNDTWEMGQKTDVWTRDLRNQLGSVQNQIAKASADMARNNVDLKLKSDIAWRAYQAGTPVPPNIYSEIKDLRDAVRASHEKIKALSALEPDILKDIDEIRNMATPPKPLNASEFFPLTPRTDLSDAEKTQLGDLFFHHMSRGVSDPAEIAAVRERVDKMVERWVGEIPFSRYSADTVGIARSMHQRDLPIDIAALVPFIDTNVERVTRHYMRRVGAEIELSRAFAGMSLAELVDSLKRRAEDSIRNVPDAQKGAARKAIVSGIDDVRAVWERITGIYGMPDAAQDLTSQAVIAAKSFTYATTSGPHAIVSLPDLMRPIHVFGFQKAYGSVIEPLLRGQLDTLKMAASEARLFGEATQTAIGMFGLMSTEFGALATRTGLGRVATTLNSTANGMHLLNLMAPFEDFTKRVATIVTGSVLMDNVLKLAGKGGGDLAEHELAQLARAYIDKDMAVRIADQFEAAVVAGQARKDGMLYAPGTVAWTDIQAQKAWRSAMSSIVNQVIVTPGIGDTPLWMSTQLGSALSMYKRFGLASTQRVLISGLQAGDANFWTGMGAMLGMGAVSAWALGAGGYGKPWENMALGERFQMALDRSGVMGVFSDAWSTWERMASDRTSWPGYVGAVAGPIGAQATHGVMAFGGLMKGELTADTFKHLSRLSPLGGIFMARPQVDAMATAMLPN